MPQHPACPYGTDTTQCRMTATNYIMQPQIPWTPEYDGMGVMTNTDPNTYCADYVCRVCGGEWTETRSGAGTTPSAVSKKDPSKDVPPAQPRQPSGATMTVQAREAAMKAPPPSKEA